MERKKRRNAKEQEAETHSYIQRELEFLEHAEAHMKRMEEKLDHIAQLLDERNSGATRRQ